MSKIKVGIIGCGTIANNAHIPSYLKCPDAEIKYFCDIIPERAEAAVKKYGCGIAVTDYKEVLADSEVAAVSVCTPNKMHSIITCDALATGKHVLCEKPAARTLPEVIKMQEAQHKYGKTLNIGVVNRFNDGVNHIKRIIDSGELGEIYSVYVSFRAYRSIPGLGGAFTTKEIAGGGALIDWGVHYLDIVMYCTGDPAPKTVSAETFCKLGCDIPNYTYTSMWAENTFDPKGTYDVEDSVVGIVRTEGPTITFNGAWAQNIGEAEQYIDFMGTKGGIRLYYGREFVMWSTKDGMLTRTTFNYNSTDMFRNEINAFARCVINGEKAPSHIDTNIITAKILQGVYDSAEAHREVTID